MLAKLLPLFLALICVPAFGQEVKLPAEVQVLPGAWCVISPEVVTGGKPKWRVDPALTEVRLDLLFPPEIAKQATGRVFSSVTPGRFKIEVWNAKADVPSDIAVTWVYVVGTPPVPPTPPPPIPPIPPVPPPPKGLARVILLHEDTKLPQPWSLNDPSVEAWLQTNVPGSWNRWDDDYVEGSFLKYPKSVTDLYMFGKGSRPDNEPTVVVEFKDGERKSYAMPEKPEVLIKLLEGFK